jgi:hypothetical protein
MAEGKSGSPLRLVILLVIMAMLGGAFGYDMYNEIPFKQMDADLTKILALGSKDKTSAASRSDVEAAINKKGGASYKTETGKYEVVHYNYSRTIPFIPGGKLYVVYDANGRFIKTGMVTSAEKITEKGMQGSVVSKDLDPNAMPSISLGGQTSTPQIPAPAANKDDAADKAQEGDKKEGDQKEEKKEGEQTGGDKKEGEGGGL